MLAEIEYRAKSAEGKLRHPFFKRLREDLERCVMDVWVYQGNELKVFASAEVAQKWFDENDPEGVAFMCPVEGAEEFEAMPSIAPSVSD